MPRLSVLLLCCTGTAPFLQGKITAPPAASEIIVLLVLFFLIEMYHLHIAYVSGIYCPSHSEQQQASSYWSLMVIKTY